MTIHLPPLFTGVLVFASCLFLTWLCNRIARRAANLVLFREMQRIANLLPTVGVFWFIDSWFPESIQPGWFRWAIVVALTAFTLCVPFTGESAWHERETRYAHTMRPASRPPTYC